MTETIPDAHRPFADWTTEQLKQYESDLYEREVDGEDVWFERDKVLWELNYRNFCDDRA